MGAFCGRYEAPKIQCLKTMGPSGWNARLLEEAQAGNVASGCLSLWDDVFFDVSGENLCRG
jgi:hypothetical protein